MVDRCQSCHIGASNPDAVNFPQPLTYHPPIIAGVENSLHDFNKMGCAICHDGNSRALEFHDAHGEFHGWPESYALLPDKTSQANCFRCHAQEGGKLAGAEHFESGRSLFLEKACWGCHGIDGVSNAKQAPELTNAGGKHGLITYMNPSNIQKRMMKTQKCQNLIGFMKKKLFQLLQHI